MLGAIMAAIMLMLSLAACDSGGGGGGGTSSGKSNADLLKEAAANMKAAKSYHIVVNGKMGGQEVKMDGDIDITNNKSKLNATAAGQSVSMVVIGGDSYISMDGGTTWTKSPGSGASGMESFTKMWDSFKPEEIDANKDAIKDGTPRDEKIGSDDTRHMTANMKDLKSLNASGSSDTEGTMDMWVTTSSKPTVRKLQMVGKSSGQDINATIEWSNVDQTVTIEAPPTQ